MHLKKFLNLFYCLCIIYFFLISKTEAQIIVTDKFDDLRLTETYLPVYVDSSKVMRFDKASKQKYTKFDPIALYKTQEKGNLYSYWHKIELKGTERTNVTLIFEVMWFSIYDFSLFIQTKDTLMKFRQGGKYPFNKRTFNYKNFIFKVPISQNEITTIYFNSPKGVVKLNDFIKLSSFDSFFEHSSGEYLFLGIFYGILVFVALYNLMVFIILRDITNFFYFLAITSFALFSLSSYDGLGFQYLWPNFPKISHILGEISFGLFIASFLAYYRSLLSLSYKYPLFNKLFLILILLRIIYCICAIINVDLLYFDWSFDLLIITIVYCVCFYLVIIKYKIAYFPLIGLTFIFSGFMIKNYMKINNVFYTEEFIYYSQYIGVMLELLFLSYAMAEKVKILGFENLLYEKKIKQKEIEIIEKLNLELEKKVQIRTQELEQSNKQLDEFSYKIAHDIKSPLNTIIGLAEVSKYEKEASTKQELIEKMKNCANSLKKLTTNLLEHTKVSLNETKFELVSINEILVQAKSQLAFMPNFDRIYFSIEGPEVNDYYSDKVLLHSIFQNIYENSIKYMDFEKEPCTIHVKIERVPSAIIISFTDNGIGIPQEKLDRVFSIFYRVNPSDNKGTGLGMYFISKSIQKLNGKIRLDSEFGKGTKLEITLPN